MNDLLNHLAGCCFGQTELFGKTLNVSVIGIPPFIEFDRNKGTLSGIDMDILTEIAKKLRFRVKVKPERSWGDNINGTWTGTVGSVKTGYESLFFRN